MSRDGLWIVDPDTGKDIYLTYEELDMGIRPQLIRPIGGFIFSADDFLATDSLGSVQFYVKDWLPKQGKMLIYAPAKSGKSYLAMQLARAIGLGDPFLGHPTDRGRVLYIQFELGEAVLRKRMIDTGLPYENIFVGTSFSLKLDLEAGQQQLIRAMEATMPQVLILDPLYKAIMGDENEAVDMRHVLDFLDSLIEAYNCSIVVIHHSGKDLSKRGRGSSVLEDWVDSYISCSAKHNKEGQLHMIFRPVFLRHAPLPDEPLELDLNEHFEFEPPPEAVMTVKQQILAFAMALRPSSFTPAQLFEAGIGSNTSVYNKLEELKEEGKIIKITRGEYKVR